eukprot:GHRR01007553.1.p1 GENE.GHRR01007553.1~~GHRR01007553.1.p1  ORF type:complete len:311 (+),score=89.80 GHRR01007553.1:220-1152(+)
MWWRKWRSAAARSSTITAAAPAGSMQTPLSTKLAECCSSAARPELAEQLQQHYKDVGSWKSRDQLPVVYHPDYNITLLGLEKLHPFDSCKFQKVAAGLQEHQVISSLKQLVQPTAVTQRTLQDVHTAEYLQELWTSSTKAAQVTELAPLAVLPASLVQRQVLKPMQTHVGGTILAAALAVVHGWAVNLGGGMHHAYWQDGSGWCPYDDITLAIRRLRKASNGAIQRVMVIDLDVHQGNGVQLDKLHFHDSDLFIVDMYNAYTFPMDTEAKAAINVKVGTQGQQQALASACHLHIGVKCYQSNRLMFPCML